MTIRSSVTVLGVMLAMLMLTGVMAAWSAPQLSFSNDRIIADGVTAGAETWWFGVVHTSRGWDHVVMCVDRAVTDDDADGSVELVWDRGVLPRQSAWLVVDMASGEHTTAAPTGMSLREIDLGPASLVYEGEQVTGVVQEQVRYLEAFLAQPGLGAWRLTSGDGSPSDDDGSADGKIVVRFATMRSQDGDMAAPESASPGDIVAVVDALELRIGVYSLTGDEKAARQSGVEVLR
jgi:hypothetical protein